MAALPSWTPGTADHLWQSTIVALCAWLLTLALRRHHARARYVVWLAASVKFLVPFAALATLGRWLPLPARMAVSTASESMFSVADAVSVPFSQAATGAAPVTAASAFVAADAIGVALLAIWFAGLAGVVVQWLRRWRQVAAFTRCGAAPASGRERAVLRRITDACSPAGIAVALVDTSLEPGVFGIVRQTLIWPRGLAARLSDAQIDAIVAHEICHVRWRDNATAAVHMAVEAAFWFHPLVWWIGARLVEEREHACDEDVLRLGGEAQAYAEGILKICEFQVASPIACVAGVTGSDLRRRIEGIMRNDVGDALRGVRKWLVAAAMAATVVVPVAAGALRAGGRAQAPPPGSTSAGAFDVVSVKENHTNDDRMVMQAQPGGRIVATNVTLRLLMRNAFRVQDFQIVGGPDWLGTARFDVEAKAAGNPAQSALQAMLRRLLADAFKIETHNETRDLPIYNLVVTRPDGKLGSQLRRSGIDCSNAPGIAPGAPPPAPAQAGTPQSQCGFRVGPGTIAARGVQLRALAASLSNAVSRVVSDRTTLDGEFDLDLKWDPAGDGNAGSIFTAVQEQLGLKLEPSKGPVDVLVVDAAVRPED